MYLPDVILRQIGQRKGMMDSLGCSGARVYMFDDMVLKIQQENVISHNECNMLRWLKGKLPVPEVIEEAFENGSSYLLMSKLPGVHLCAKEYLDDQVRLAELMAEAIRLMWSIDISDCPEKGTIAIRLREIEKRLAGGMITVGQASQKETYGPGDFRTPSELFDWLVANQPTEELVFSHGDFCLPNVFAIGKHIGGFIDVGYAGVADKWLDIEKGLWSMWANTTGHFGGKARSFDRQIFFDALGIAPDDDKLRYYALLDELF